MNTIYVDFANLGADGRIRGHRTQAGLQERVQVEDHSKDMQCQAIVESMTDDGLPMLRVDQGTRTGTGWVR